MAKKIIFPNTKTPDESIQLAIRHMVAQDLKTVAARLSKFERETIQAILGNLNDVQSISDAVQKDMKCSPEEARKYIDNFIVHANERLDENYLDLDAIAEIALHTPKVQKYWEKVRQEVINGAKAEAETIQANAEVEVETIRFNAETEAETIRFNAEAEAEAIRAKANEDAEKVKTDMSRAQSAYDKFRRQKEDLTIEIQSHNKNIQEIDSLLESKRAELQSINDELVSAVQRELEKASENVADFLAKRCCYSSGTSVAANPTPPPTPISPSLYVPGEPLSNNVSSVNSWSDCFKTLVESNLKSVKQDDQLLTGAFLYASYALKNNLLLAGPSGEYLANALSTAVCGKFAGTLDCDGDWNNESVLAAENGSDEIVVVKNALYSRWLERWPERLAKSKKFWIFTCPFADDLAIQSRGLFDYLFPVLTEGFVEEEKLSLSFVGRICKGKTLQYNNQATELGDENKRVLKKAKASSIYAVRLKKIVDCAVRIYNTQKNIEEEQKQELFYLFGAASYAYATGNTDALKGIFVDERYDDWRDFVKLLFGDDNDK